MFINNIYEYNFVVYRPIPPIDVTKPTLLQQE